MSASHVLVRTEEPALTASTLIRASALQVSGGKIVKKVDFVIVAGPFLWNEEKNSSLVA